MPSAENVDAPSGGGGMVVGNPWGTAPHDGRLVEERVRFHQEISAWHRTHRWEIHGAQYEKGRPPIRIQCMWMG